MLRKTLVITESIAKLLKYAEPRVQRQLDMNHVNNMVMDQKTEYMRHECFSMMQSITVAYVREENTFYVLDGNHRLKAFSELAAQGYAVQDVAIPVVQYHVENQSEMMDYYMRINKNMPIHPLEATNTYADYEKVLLDRFMKTFPSYIKDHGGSARCPNISLQELKRHLHAREIGSKLQEKNVSIEDLWSIIMHLNVYVQTELKGRQLDPAIQKRIADCDAKHNAVGYSTCYLGIWRKFEWLDICMFHLETGNDFSKCCEHICLQANNHRRKRVPAVVRQEVWKKLNSNVSDTGQCFVCEQDLLFPDMECGHIHAHALGGVESIDNFMPVCKTCNRDMGIMNMLEYKTLLINMLGAKK